MTLTKLFVFFVSVIFSAFIFCAPILASEANEEIVKAQGPSHVEIIKVNGAFQLMVNKKPFVVKGAGINYEDGHNYKALVAAGGNSFRTWTAKNADIELAQAKDNNLMVALGFDLQKELHGFDYNDKEAVAKQFTRAKAIVDKYKDHPNLLFWVVANEPNLLFNKYGSLAKVNPKVYDAISDIIDYIHQVDPNHPVTYSFAGVIKDHIDVALKHTPQVDFISVQVYGDLKNIPNLITEANITKPFMITEFGPLGHWETPSTTWGREIEEPSSIKAAGLADRMNHGLAGNPTKLNIGHFAFEWGQKQERTPTWYGIFNQDGKANARLDELTKFWTGSYPKNRAPLTSDIVLNNQKAIDSIHLNPNQKVTASVTVQDPNNDQLTFQWTILKEVQLRSQGGAFEKKPEVIEIKFTSLDPINEPHIVSFQTPSISGEYRLFSYVYDGKGKVGNANIPFYVKENN